MFHFYENDFFYGNIRVGLTEMLQESNAINLAEVQRDLRSRCDLCSALNVHPFIFLALLQAHFRSQAFPVYN